MTFVEVAVKLETKFGALILKKTEFRGETTLVFAKQEIRDFCKGQIAHYKVPRYIEFVTEFPMTVTGKIQKFKMREVAVAELGLESAAAVVTA